MESDLTYSGAEMLAIERVEGRFLISGGKGQFLVPQELLLVPQESLFALHESVLVPRESSHVAQETTLVPSVDICGT